MKKKSIVLRTLLLAESIIGLTGCSNTREMSGGMSDIIISYSGKILNVDREKEKMEVCLLDTGKTANLDFSGTEDIRESELKEGEYIYYTTWGSTPEVIDKIEKTASYPLNYETGSGEILSVNTAEMTITVELDNGGEFYNENIVVLDYSNSTGWLRNNKDFQVKKGDMIYYSFFDGKPEEIDYIARITTEE